MNNLVELFPDSTDSEYEDRIVPILINVLSQFHEAVDNGQFDVIEPASKSLLNYSMRSMLYLDETRKLGMFKNNQFPEFLSSAIDNLAADTVLALGGDDVEILARSLRDRSPTKRNSRVRSQELWNDPKLHVRKRTLIEWIRRWSAIDIGIGWQSKSNYENWKMWTLSAYHNQWPGVVSKGTFGSYIITLLGFYVRMQLFTLGNESKQWVKTDG